MLLESTLYYIYSWCHYCTSHFKSMNKKIAHDILPWKNRSWHRRYVNSEGLNLYTVASQRWQFCIYMYIIIAELWNYRKSSHTIDTNIYRMKTDNGSELCSHKAHLNTSNCSIRLWRYQRANQNLLVLGIVVLRVHVKSYDRSHINLICSAVYDGELRKYKGINQQGVVNIVDFVFA
jgi:hypothetical protein